MYIALLKHLIIQYSDIYSNIISMQHKRSIRIMSVWLEFSRRHV